MEPLRPLVDWTVWEIGLEQTGSQGLSPETKQQILGVLNDPCRISGGMNPLMMALHAYITSFRRCLAGDGKERIIPGLG